jgi:hypothetical protein
MRVHPKHAIPVVIFGVAGIWHETLAAEFECQHGNMTRRVQVLAGEAAQDLACEVRYWRDAAVPSDGEVLWQASQDEDYCDAKARNLLERLRAGGWTCAASDRPVSPETTRAADATASAASEPPPSPPAPESGRPDDAHLAGDPAAGVAGRTAPPGSAEPPAAPSAATASPTPAAAPQVRQARLPAEPVPAAARDKLRAPTDQSGRPPGDGPSTASLDHLVQQTLRSVQELYGGDFRADDAAFGDLDGDGRNDAAVLVTYEVDRDDYVQYLVAYLFDGATFQSTATKNVGGRFLDALRAEIHGIVDGAILVDLQALDGGAACCETHRTAFALKEGQLVEVEDLAGPDPERTDRTIGSSPG